MTITEDMQDAILALPERVWSRLRRGGEVRPGAWVAELTGLLDLAGWPAGMRVIVRRERPTPAPSCASPTSTAAGSPPAPRPPHLLPGTAPPPATARGPYRRGRHRVRRGAGLEHRMDRAADPRCLLRLPRRRLPDSQRHRRLRRHGHHPWPVDGQHRHPEDELADFRARTFALVRDAGGIHCLPTAGSGPLASAVACHGGCRPVVIRFSFDDYVLPAFTNGTTNTWPIVL